MNDILHDLMRDSADAIPTSVAPIAAITRAGRRRRTRAVALVAAAVVVLGGTAAAAVPGLAGDHEAGPAAPTRHYAPDDVPVFLPESAFDVGVDKQEDHASVSGELVATQDDRCLVVGDDQTPVFWPHGYEGETHGDGSFSLLDEQGSPVAEVGDTVRLTGGWLEPASWSGDERCIPDDRKVFMVQARPEVVGP
ncbi:hypothetical protein GCM10009844_01540 [Nocardioides koreensis]|uniref:Uncharacterized protein n=1 Tax=Nocardioides koreensis TaxID=433651 RepID=A0ABN2Z2Q2_9ACTN